MLKRYVLLSLVLITTFLMIALAIVFSGIFSPAAAAAWKTIYQPLTSPALDDVLVVEDTSDPTMSPQGTTKYLLLQYLPISDPVQAALNSHTSTYDHHTYDTAVINAGNLITLTGMPADSIHFGTFTGSLVPDDSDLKTILQTFETAIEGLGGGHDPVTLDVNADMFFSLSGQQLGLDSQAVNTVFAGPAGGGPGVPGFRSLAAEDIPDLGNIYRPLVVFEGADLSDTSSPHDLTAAEMEGGVISNADATGSENYNAPARSSGWNVEFIVESANAMIVNPNGTEQWFLNGTPGTAGQNLQNTSPAVGASMVCISTKNAVYCESKYAAWQFE